MEFICESCKKSFVSAKNLEMHLNTAKYCLELRGEIIKEIFNCENCQNTFVNKSSMVRHFKNCSSKPTIKSIINYKSEIDCNKQIMKIQDDKIRDLENKVKELTTK